VWLRCVYLPDACSTVFTSRRQVFSVRTEINGRYLVFMADASNFATIPRILVHLPYPGGVVIAGRGNLVTTWANGDIPYFSWVMQLCERNPIKRVHQPNGVSRSQSKVVPVLAETDCANRPW